MELRNRSARSVNFRCWWCLIHLDTTVGIQVGREIKGSVSLTRQISVRVVPNWGFIERNDSHINCAFDFPGKKANLHLPLLNIFGGCAMLGLCTYYSPEDTAKYQRNPDHIVCFLKPKIVETDEIPESRFFLTLRYLLSLYWLIFHQSSNLYLGGSPMKKPLKLYMPCSW